MKPTLLALFSIVTFSGCAGTSFYSRGQKVLTVQANLTDVSYRYSADGSIDFKARLMNHSTPTRAAGSVIGTAGTALSGIVTAGAVFAK